MPVNRTPPQRPHHLPVRLPQGARHARLRDLLELGHKPQGAGRGEQPARRARVLVEGAGAAGARRGAGGALDLRGEPGVLLDPGSGKPDRGVGFAAEPGD